MHKTVHIDGHELVIIIAVGIGCLTCASEAVVTDKELSQAQLDAIARILLSTPDVYRSTTHA